jgi:hypothetical protein
LGLTNGFGMAETRDKRLKVLGQSRLLQHTIRRLPRENTAIHHKSALRDRTEPDFVIPFTVPHKSTTGSVQKLFQVWRIICHLRNQSHFAVRLEMNSGIGWNILEQFWNHDLDFVA